MLCKLSDSAGLSRSDYIRQLIIKEYDIHPDKNFWKTLPFEKPTF